MKIGIGVTTFNRKHILKECLKNLKAHSENSEIVIVDDCSEDPFSSDEYHVIRHDVQQGIAKSKNDCLRYLLQKECDNFFLFDDDCWPIKSDWEKKYVEYASFFSMEALCYSWERYLDNRFSDFSRVLEILEAPKKDHLVIEDHVIPFEHPLTTTFLIETKRSLGFHPFCPHEIKSLPVSEHAIKIHKNCFGVMIYLTKRCIETIGGFCEDFPFYGGEHVDFFNRAYNTGMISKKFPDVVGSDDLFRALDREKDHISTVEKIEKEGKNFIKQGSNLIEASHIDRMLRRRKNSTEKINL